MMRVLPIAPTPTAQTFQASGVSGKLSAPVNPAAAVYAQFRHIVGVSASDGMDAVPLFKLRILDNLIESYVKTQKTHGLSSEDIQVSVSARTVDTTIAALSADLRDAILSTAASPGAPHPPRGILVDLAA